MPATNGASGPTTVRSIDLDFANFKRPVVSSGFIFTGSAISAIPSLPGAQYSFSHFGLCAIFHARACSLPPEPISNIRISGSYYDFLLTFYDLTYGMRL